VRLTPEQRAIGRRNFLRALAGTPALATLGGASAMAAPVRGGPVRIGFIGVGGQGRALLGHVDPAFGQVIAMADINPASLARADEVLAKRKQGPATHYVEWQEMLHRENVEAVIVAVPLWAHADVVVPCLEAGKHVLCEKMMAWDVDGCKRMKAAAVKANRVLEIGYQRNYNPVYRAAYDGIIKRELLGDVYHVRLAWHRNGNWRRAGEPPSTDYDPSRFGYPTFEHLWNWRLYWKYSRGLFAELCSHQLNATNWYVNAAPTAVHAYGGVHRYRDGREAHDHVYAIFEYPKGLTATFSSIESNAADQRYETFFGTKATLVMYNESEAMLFDETAGAQSAATGVEVSRTPSGAGVEASETKPANSGRPSASAGSAPPAPNETTRASATELEISGFCSAIRTGTPLECGPDRAFDSARACIAACEAAIANSTKVAIAT
jgi:predicted dehydrogenase